MVGALVFAFSDKFGLGGNGGNFIHDLHSLGVR